MKTRALRFLAFFALCACAAHAQALRGNANMAYIYPAGGQAGTTFRVWVGGSDGVRGAVGLSFSGGIATAKLVAVDNPPHKGALIRHHKKIEELALKENPDLNVKQLQDRVQQIYRERPEYKKEYDELQRSYQTREISSDALACIAAFDVTIKPDAKPGAYSVALRTRNGLTNVLPFFVGELPEYTTPLFRDTVRQDASERARARAFALNADAPRARIRPEGGETYALETLPVVANGQITFARPDTFRFQAKKGQQIVVCVWARALIPYISDAVPGWFQPVATVRDAKGNEIAYCDDFDGDPDPLLAFTVPEDGEYSVEIKDAVARGREDFVYRMLIGEVPFAARVEPLGIAAEKEAELSVFGWNLPQNTLSYTAANSGRAALKIPNVFHKPLCVRALRGEVQTYTGEPMEIARIPASINGKIGAPNARHIYRIRGKKGMTIECEVLARRLNSPLDAYLRLVGPDGAQVAFSDDEFDKLAALKTHHADPHFICTLPQTGVYTLELADAQGRGGDAYNYLLRVAPPAKDFALLLENSTLNLEAGKYAALTVHAVRRGNLTAPIRLRLRGAPEGATISGGMIPEGADKAVITIGLPKTAPSSLRSVHIEGIVERKGKDPIVRRAVACEPMMQAFYIPHLVPYGDLALNAIGKKAQRGDRWARAFDTPQSPLACVRLPRGGGEVSIDLGNAALPEGAQNPELQLVGAPEALSVVQTQIDENGRLLARVHIDPKHAEKMQDGNLVFNLSAERKAPSKKGVRRVRVQLGTLPALPYILKDEGAENAAKPSAAAREKSAGN